MRPGHDEHVARDEGLQVQERDGTVGRRHDARLAAPVDDAAEDALAVDLGGQVLAQATAS